MKYALTLMLLAPLCLDLFAGCDVEPSRPPLSEAFLKFNPRRQFVAVGCEVEQGPAEGRVSPREAYGWRPFQGTLDLPADTDGCEFVVKAIRDAVLEATPGPLQDELTPNDDRGRGQPLYGLLRYNNEHTRGVIYVWLFPDKAENRITYAILLHEERIRNDS